MLYSIKKMAFSSAILMMESFLRLAISAALAFEMARKLGPNDFGILNSISASLALLITVGALGLDAVLLIELPRVRNPLRWVVAAVMLRGIFALLFFLCSLVMYYFFTGGVGFIFLLNAVVAVSIFGYAPNVIDCWYRSESRPLSPAILRVMAAITSAVLKLALIHMSSNLTWFAYAIVFEYFLVGLGYFFIFKMDAPDGVWSDNFRGRRRIFLFLLRKSRHYYIASIASVVLMKIDVVMLGYMSSFKETGIYSLTQKISEILCIVPVVLVDAVYPIVVKTAALGRSEIASQKFFDLVIAGTYGAIFISMISVEYLVEFFFGPGYEQSVTFFYYHAWSCVAVALGVARMRWMGYLGLGKYAPGLEISGALVNVSLNYILIPTYGAMGAVVSTLVSYFFSNYMSAVFVADLRPILVLQSKSIFPWGRLYCYLKGV